MKVTFKGIEYELIGWSRQELSEELKDILLEVDLVLLGFIEEMPTNMGIYITDILLEYGDKILINAYPKYLFMRDNLHLKGTYIYKRCQSNQE